MVVIVVKPKYKHSQDEVYTGLEMVGANALLDQLKLVAHKPKYVVAFIGTFINDIAAARAIPDFVQRANMNEAQRKLLCLRLVPEKNSLEVADGEAALDNLKSYIEGAYKNKSVQKSRLSEAGFGDYKKVMKFNWDKVKSMFLKGKEFLVKYETELTADGNMLAAFILIFNGVADSIIAEVDAYLAEREAVRLLRQDKIVATNNVVDRGMEICKDGKTVFKRNPAKKNLYIWKKVMEIVTPPGAAGLRGTVKADGTFLPIGGAVIEMQQAGSPVVVFETNEIGSYYSGHLPVGQYSYKLSKAGFVIIETSVEIKTGVTSYKHFVMSAGSGTVLVVEGGMDVNVINNIPIPEWANDDTTVRIDAFIAQMQFFAADTADGGITGTGALYGNVGFPLIMKWSELKAQLGLSAEHPFYNVRNVGAVAGEWKVTFG